MFRIFCFVSTFLTIISLSEPIFFPAVAQQLIPTQTTPAVPNPLKLESKFQEAYRNIYSRYIDQPQTSAMIIGGAREILKLKGLEDLQYSDLISPTQRLGSEKDDFEAFRLLLQKIRAIKGDAVPLDQIVSAMIRGMVESLDDEYSSYMEPEKNRELQEYLMGESRSFGGIGIEFEFNKQGQCLVISPIPNSPAYRAGIRPGDIILQVDGVEVNNKIDARDKMMGNPGSPVVVTVRRDQVKEPLVYDLVRELIVQPEMEKILLTKTIGYVRVNSFNENSGKDLLENLRYLEGLGMKKCILDLRRNAGGLLKAAVEISDIFLPKGTLVVKTKGRIASADREYRTKENIPFTRIPLIVLVDGHTASAAEIVTGAIRDNRRGKAVGTTTFGKGTVQEVIQLDDNSGLKLTVARYYTPSGESIDNKGIKPDYEVKSDTVLNPAILFPDASRINTDTLAQDLQLRKAFEILGEPLPIPGT